MNSSSQMDYIGTLSLFAHKWNLFRALREAVSGIFKEG
jgi:hypothetical protein